VWAGGQVFASLREMQEVVIAVGSSKSAVGIIMGKMGHKWADFRC